MRKICSWCRTELGIIEGENPFGGGCTHGVCPSCRDLLLSRREFPALSASSSQAQ